MLATSVSMHAFGADYSVTNARPEARNGMGSMGDRTDHATNTFDRGNGRADMGSSDDCGTNAMHDADNTSRNTRDGNSNTLTPLDQGNGQADIDTTAQIRKGILAGEDMSVNARNVKIITANGKVTLRGPVNTTEEKRRIGEIASNIAQMENVDNRLEVKSNP